MFPKNAWYVACMPDEIDSKPLGRRICGEAMVIYRGPENKAAALEDFCPHRGAPLSLGSVSKASWCAATTGWRWAATAATWS